MIWGEHVHVTLHYTKLHFASLFCTTLFYTPLHSTTLHYTTLHYTTLHYTTLHYTTLHYTTLHCFAMHYLKKNSEVASAQANKNLEKSFSPIIPKKQIKLTYSEKDMTLPSSFLGLIEVVRNVLRSPSDFNSNAEKILLVDTSSSDSSSSSSDREEWVRASISSSLFSSLVGTM